MAEKPLIVIKIGGSIANNPQAIAKDIAASQGKYSFIIAHGGAAQTNELMQKLGLTPKSITSASGIKSRYTNAEAIEVFTLALAGKTSSKLVLALQASGVNAIGLSGFDGKAVLAKQKILTAIEDGKQRIVRDDYSGKIEKINTELLHSLLESGYSPVLAALVMGESFQPLNVDGDRLASAIATAMHAKTLISLTDVDGYFSNFPNDLVPRLGRSSLDDAVKNAGAGKMSGGMKKKLMASAEALDGGVHEVIIGNGTVESPISKLLAGAGTHITNNERA